MRSDLVHHYYSMFSTTLEMTMVTSFHILSHSGPALPIGFGAFAVYAVVTLVYLRHSVLEARKL